MAELEQNQFELSWDGFFMMKEGGENETNTVDITVKPVIGKVVQGLDGGSKRSFIPFFGRSEKGLAHSLMEWIK